MTTLTNDGLLAVAHRLGVQTMPLVLAVGPEQDSYAEWRLAQEAAVAELTGAGLIDEAGEVDGELAAALFVLAQPDRQLAARTVTADGTRRGCLVRRGEQHALAVRDGARYQVRPIWLDGSNSAAAAPLLTTLDALTPADVPAFSAPADELADRLDAAATVSDYTDAFYASGAPERDATRLGSALARTHACTEIVALAHEDGRTARAPGAVAVYDTDRGRIVAAPSLAPDGRLWTTVTSGSDHRVAHAIGALLEGLPGGRWLAH
ncbi:ESX secretion-associated protein EspG [Nocardia harenae]|uniref:ESX secretion-associated protein EspG n=1 Tax=Nocardia harenae TaxID=358707 RepID=UPI00082A426A|nr:ESX secretion-associated protein EspG [Nocardia harenae]